MKAPDKYRFSASLSIIFCALFLCTNSGNAHIDDSIETNTIDIGEVHFPISCNAEAQIGFERAQALLHHMMYSQAEKEFTALAMLDPECAMTHWGIAMPHLRGGLDGELVAGADG